MNWFVPSGSYRLDRFQQIALTLMSVATLLTFIGTNIQALWWQSSDWLVGAVLPAVVIDLTNTERTGVAAQPLRRSATLDAAATQKAQHMAANGYFAHFAPDGTSPWYFFEQAGYTYAHAGENLAIHFTDSAEVVEAWMNSPAHKENIINRDFVEIGVGTARGTFDGYDTVFVVQLFGTPAQTSASEVPQVTRSQDSVAAPAPTSLATLENIRAELASIQAQADVLAANQTFVQELREPAEVLTTVIEEKLPHTPATESDQIDRVAVLPDQLVIETEIATSSGLAAARVVDELSITSQTADLGLATALTRPSLVLDVVYSTVLSIIIVLLTIALLGETRRLHFVQAVYSLLLIAGVGGLWYVHTVLTSGAVVL